MAQASVRPRTPSQTPTPDVVEPVSIDLALALFDVVRLSRRTRRTDPIGPSSAVVLASVDRLAPARPSDIACELRLDLSTVSRHLTRLEEEGHLRRTEDAEDRRARRVEPTEQGSAALADVLANRAATLDEAVSSWSSDDRAHLTELLRRLATELEAAQ